MAGFKAIEDRFTFLNGKSKLIIPFFQRKYVWKEENWDELFDNFFMKDEPGFLGSVLVQWDEISAGNMALDVIDGQQRLTTISILVMAIYDSIQSENKENAKDQMYTSLFSKETFQVEYTPKLEHSKFDREDYEKVMSFDKNLEEIEGKKIGILGCYNHFMDRLKSIPDPQKEKVLSDFLNGRYLIWVIITIDKDMDEQSIFDTLNNSGVSLTASDTIKNSIFKKASELYNQKYPTNDKAKSKAITDLYENNWEEVFINGEGVEEYWNSEITTGHMKRTKLDLFLYCFAVIKGFFSQNDYNMSDLTKVYKNYMSEHIKTTDDINEFLKELKKLAEIFKDKFENNNKETLYTYKKDKVLTRLLHLLQVNDVTTFHPLILNILYKYENKTNVINKQLHLLEKYLIINYLNEDTSKMKNYNKMCTAMINNDQKLVEEVKEVSKNIRYTLFNDISNQFAAYFLFWIELYRRSDSDDETSLQYVYSLEHIMPRSWQKNWFHDIEVGLKNAKGKKMDLDVAQSIEYRNNHINMLGNMTLLKGKLNTSISNKDFDTKMVSIKEHASLKITRNDIVDRYYSKKKREKLSAWNENTIEARTNSLKEEVKNAFLY